MICLGKNRHIMVNVSKSDDNDHYNILLIKYGMDCLTSITIDDDHIVITNNLEKGEQLR